jgi:hypothetical protein
MKHHIASPGVLGAAGSEHRIFGQITHTQLQPTSPAHKSAEAALAELSVSLRAREQRGAQNADVVARKRPAEMLLSEAVGTTVAASPGTHAGGGDPRAEESEALQNRRSGPHPRKTKNA